MVGAVAVGPDAGECTGQLTLVVRARTPIEIRLDTTQTPSYPAMVTPLQARKERLYGF